MTADELVTILGVEISADTMANIDKFKAGLGTVVSKLNMLALAAGGFATAAGFFVKSVMDEAGSLQTLADKSGLSTDSLQEWAYAAKQSGVEAKAVQNDLINLNKTMSSPIPGQFNVNMAMLGVRVRDSNGALKDAETLLQDVGDKLEGMSHQRALQWGQKVGLSDDTIVLLRQGSEGVAKLRQEAHDLGAIIPNESIQRSEEFRKSLGKLTAAFRGMSTAVAIAAMPAIQRVTELFTQWIVRNREWIQVHTESFMVALVSAWEKFWAVLKRVLTVFQPLIDKFKDLTGGMSDTEHYMSVLTGAFGALLIIFSPILAKIALMSAAFYAASLIVEDFMYWLNGDESLIGAGLKAFVDKFPAMARLFEKLKDAAVSLFRDAFQLGTEAVKVFGAAFAEVIGNIAANIETASAPLAEFIDGFKKDFPAVIALVKILGGLIGTALGMALKNLVGVFKLVADTATSVFTFLLSALEKVLGFVETILKKLGLAKEESSDVGSNLGVGKNDATPEGRTALNRNVDKYGGLGAPMPLTVSASTVPTTQKITKDAPRLAAPTINDNRTINQQITTSDPLQAGNAALQGLGGVGYGTLTPGPYAPVAR